MRAKQISFHKLLRNYLYIRGCTYRFCIDSLHFSSWRKCSFGSKFLFLSLFFEHCLFKLRYFSSNPSIPTRYRKKRRGKRRERKVREAVLLLRSFSNRIESNLVAFRRVEKRSGVRFFLVRFSGRVENTRKSIEVVVFPVERREFFSQSRTIATPFPT